MKFFYTGALKYKEEQRYAYMSLGGFLSSSEVQNDLSNNVFDEESRLAVQKLQRTAVLLALQNCDDEEAENVTFTFTVADWTKLTSDYSIAFVKSKTNKCGEIFFDKITDRYAVPFVKLEKLCSTNNSFVLGTLQPGETIGIWLVRKIVPNANTEPLSPQQLYCNYLGEQYIDTATGIIYNPIEVPEEECFSLDLSWNEEPSDSQSCSDSSIIQ